MWRALASFFYHCGNFIFRTVSSHLPKGRDAPSNCSPPHSASSPLSPWSLATLSLSQPSLTPSYCCSGLLGLVSHGHLLCGSPYPLTCQRLDPLESTGTAHQWPGAEQLYQLSLGKLKYPVILAVWSLKLSPTYYSRQNQGPAKLNRVLPETFTDWLEKEAPMWRESIVRLLLFF